MSLLGEGAESLLNGWIKLVRKMVKYSEEGYYITPVLIYRELGE